MTLNVRRNLLTTDFPPLTQYVNGVRDLSGRHGGDLAAVVAGVLLRGVVDLQRVAAHQLDAPVGRHLHLAGGQDGDAALPGDDIIVWGRMQNLEY